MSPRDHGPGTRPRTRPSGTTLTRRSRPGSAVFGEAASLFVCLPRPKPVVPPRCPPSQVATEPGLAPAVLPALTGDHSVYKRVAHYDAEQDEQSKGRVPHGSAHWRNPLFCWCESSSLPTRASSLRPRRRGRVQAMEAARRKDATSGRRSSRRSLGRRRAIRVAAQDRREVPQPTQLLDACSPFGRGFKPRESELVALIRWTWSGSWRTTGEYGQRRRRPGGEAAARRAVPHEVSARTANRMSPECRHSGAQARCSR